jgi:RNA polymerase sigma factor (sigma-70 family)
MREKLVALLGVMLGASAAPGDAALRETWETLYPLWSRYLFGVGRKKFGLRPEVLEDVIQDVLCRILGRWETYRKVGANGLLAVSCKALRNRALDEVRRRNRWRIALRDALCEEGTPPEVSEGGSLLRSRERCEWLYARLVELKGEQPENCKLVCLHHLEGHSYKELADGQGYTVDAIKGRLKRGLQGLRELAAECPLAGETPP